MTVLTDGHIDDLFRAANPVPEVRHRLTARQIALRERIVRDDGRQISRVPRRQWIWAGAGTAVAAVAVAVLVVINVVMPTQQAIALTPPSLVYTSAPALTEVIANAQESLRTAAPVAQVSRVDASRWAWSIDIETTHVESIPQETTLTWGDGEPMVSTIIAGTPFWTDETRPDGIDSSPYTPGELIDESVTPADEVIIPEATRTLDGTAETDLLPALEEFGATADSNSGDLMAAISGVMDYWTLSNAQEATLVGMLGRSEGVTVLGRTTDRLGRDVIGLRVTPAIPEREETVLLSVDTGRIVGYESEFTKPFEGLPVGVVSYVSWDAGDPSIP